jgi:hypothetical protein
MPRSGIGVDRRHLESLADRVRDVVIGLCVHVAPATDASVPGGNSGLRPW